MIRKFLDCSAAHLSLQTREKFGITHPASVFIKVPPQQDGETLTRAFERLAWPLDLILVALKARRLGCHYILFDRDAETIEGLEVYSD